MLELTEEAFDQIALAVDAPIHGPVYEALAGRWDVGISAAGPYQIQERVGIVTSISDDMLTFEAGEQKRRGP